LLPWSLLLGFIWAVVGGVLMGMLAAWLQGGHFRRLRPSRARNPRATMHGRTLGREPAARS